MEGTNTLTVSSDQLYRAYDANEIGADQQYRDQILRVTGAVQSINKNILDDPYVVLWTPNEFMGTHCQFTGDGAGLARVSKGDHISVRCRGAGKVVGSPILRDCVLE